MLTYLKSPVLRSAMNAGLVDDAAVAVRVNQFRGEQLVERGHVVLHHGGEPIALGLAHVRVGALRGRRPSDNQ